MSNINYDLQKEKIISTQEDYLKVGQDKGYFVMDSNKIKYTATNKGYNFNDPEEKVRAEFYLDLLEKYQYPAKRIDLKVKTKPDKDAADIVVYVKYPIF